MDGGSYVVDGGEVGGGEVLAELVDHVDEDIGGGGGDAGAGGHGAGALHGVVGAEDEGHGVEEVDGGLVGLVGFLRGSHRCLMVSRGAVGKGFCEWYTPLPPARPKVRLLKDLGLDLV